MSHESGEIGTADFPVDGDRKGPRGDSRPTASSRRDTRQRGTIHFESGEMFQMSYLGGLLGPMRMSFLILTPACVLLGLGTAFWSSREIDWAYFVLILAGAISAHISVNTFNEYFDFKSGLDLITKRTPFSGGTGTLPKMPGMAGTTIAVAVITLLITAIIGLFFLYVRGAAILPLYIPGLLLVAAYTPWIVRSPFLCLISPGLGFGPLMVIGTHFCLTGEYSWTSVIASMVPFFLVNNLLLLNQFPDVEADKCVGRKHLLIVLGRSGSSLVFGLFLFLAYLSIVLGVVSGYMPRSSLIGLIAVTIAV
ncbi:MAG TPA: prenyltransferase, partial [Syntrophales bacterium]|nr:prenyltransferase [Syntrophales bacterium]